MKSKRKYYNAEFDVVNNLYSSVSAEDWKFDEIKAKVIPKSSYVFLGMSTRPKFSLQHMIPSRILMFDIYSVPIRLHPAIYKNATPLEGEQGVVIIKLPGKFRRP